MRGLVLGGLFGVTMAGGTALADQFHYNNVLVGTRSVGMGGAFGAVSDDASGVYYNPAAPWDIPEAEAELRWVTSGANKRFADGAIAGGVVVLGGCGYWLRHRMRTS